MTLVAINAVTRTYGSRRAVWDVSAHFEPGVTALLGRNGAGKSTLLRVMATVEEPDCGTLALDGVTVLRRKLVREYRGRLGWLPQQFNYPVMSSVRDYVAYVAWLKKLPKATRQAAVANAVESVDLADRLDDRIGSLSGGMLRRVGLAQALVNTPDVLLLDEPTTGLDPEQRGDLCSLIRRSSRERVVVLATHLLEDVALSADHVLAMDDGSVWFHGSIEDFAGCSREKVTVEQLARRFSSRREDTSSTETPPGA